MAGKTFKLSIVVDATTASATKGLSGLGKTLGKLGMAAAGVGTAVVGGLAVAGGAVAKLAIDAAPLQGIEAAFEGITEASGKSSREMLKALKKGSAGMITQKDLMMKYNLAAQLVGDQFANKLPDAMGFLSKVAAATGEDMGFMMDSLVRGVGRLSPMILDNLGIQVDLQSAYEAFAPTIGKTVSELSKQEQQAALMNQVMEKLAQNTANMPEVAGTAAAGIAALRTKFIDLKDSIGVAFLPVLTRLLDMFGSLIDKYGPMLTDWAERAGEGIAGLVDEIAGAIEGGWPAIMEMLAEWGQRFWDWLTETVVPLAAEKLTAVTESMQAWAESSDTQAWLAQIGETAGRGLADGVEALVQQAAVWTPILNKAAQAIADAVVAISPALIGIGVNMAKGILQGLVEGLKETASVEGALRGLVAGLLGPLAFFIPGLASPLPGFQFGGTMPGSPSQAGLAVLHGGETVTPAGRGGGVNLTGEAIQLLRTIAGKENIIVVETSDGGATRDHFLNLRDRASALPAGA